MTHPIPAAIDFLVKAFTVEFGELQVLDGPPSVELADEGVAVGYVPDRLTAETEQGGDGLAGGGLGGDAIGFDVNCLLWKRTGDREVKPVRDQLFDRYAQLGRYVKGNRRLGGAVTNARLRLADYDQLQTEDGPFATIAFVVTCKAFDEE